MAGGSSSRADGSLGAAEAASKLERAESPKARRGCAEDQSASLNAPHQGGPQGHSQWLGGLRRPVGEARCSRSVSHSVVPSCLNPARYSLPGSSVHGILQARILEWIASPFSRESSQPRIQLMSPVFLHCRFFPVEPPGKPKDT